MPTGVYCICNLVILDITISQIKVKISLKNSILEDPQYVKQHTHGLEKNPADCTNYIHHQIVDYSSSLFSKSECLPKSGSFVELTATTHTNLLGITLPQIGKRSVLSERRVLDEHEASIRGTTKEGQVEEIFLTRPVCWKYIANSNIYFLKKILLLPPYLGKYTYIKKKRSHYFKCWKNIWEIQIFFYSRHI